MHREFLAHFRPADQKIAWQNYVWARKALAAEEKDNLILLGQRCSIYDEPLYEANNPHSVSRTFGPVIPGHTDSPSTAMQTDIENTLQGKRGKAVCVELGGPGRRVFDAFSPGFFAYVRGFSLEDNIDLFSHDGIEKVRSLIPNGQADCIESRIAGPIRSSPNASYPRNIVLFGNIARDWYSLLAPHGIMYVEFPTMFAALAIQLKQKLDRLHPGCIDITIAQAGERLSYVMRLVKKDGAPEVLPLLDIYDIAFG